MDTTRKMPELLAPAGDRERLEAALRFGADAVYLGGPMLQLRADTVGFSPEALREAAETVHRAARRLYVTVNAIVREGELSLLPDYARMLRTAGADAAIVSDLGALRVMKEAAPELELHVSTQANCMNSAAARVYSDMGAKRVILARETTLEEIRRIRDAAPPELELECFVHGAMCMSYSGRCLLSAYLMGRSGNRGDCAQPCRYAYTVSLADRDTGEQLPLLEEENGTTLLSGRDLNAMPFLDKLIDAGVSSLKIEGRMKSTYYVATVTNAYRRRLDGTASLEECLRELDCASHRNYTSGFYFGAARTEPAADPGYAQSCRFAALVLEKRGDGLYLIEQRNRFSRGDRLELLSPRSLGESFPVEELWDEKGTPVEAAPHPKQRLLLRAPLELEPGDILRQRG